MDKIKYLMPDRSQNEDKGRLLGTFFRDRTEEVLLEDESFDRAETDLHNGTHLRNDIAIVEMLYSGEADAFFLPDRIEVRTTKRYENLLDQSAIDEPSQSPLIFTT